MDRNTKQRRRHSAELKAQVLQACAVPGAAVAAVAREFGLNDNLVHQWRRGRGVGVPRSKTSSEPADAAPQFIALPLPGLATPVAATETATPIASDIRLELKRAGLQVSVTWPLSAAGQCAAWLREVLR